MQPDRGPLWARVLYKLHDFSDIYNMYLRESNRLFLNCGKNKREDMCKIYQGILFLNSIQY